MKISEREHSRDKRTIQRWLDKLPAGEVGA